MSKNNYFPIILFGYKRPEHLSQCWRSLAESPLASKTNIYLFLDGPKSINEKSPVKRTVNEALKIKGFNRVFIKISKKNLGLSKSIIQGIKAVSVESKAWIVVEDDLFVGKHFLEYMNDGLKCYFNRKSVASIHGYVYPTTKRLPETFFLKGADCWGWGSWTRAWQKFETDGRRLLSSLLVHNGLADFTFNGGAPYLQMLKDQIQGKNDSWAIRWYASAFLAGMYTLYPGRSLVQNIGMDSSGTHCEASTKFKVDLSSTPINVVRLPVQENRDARNAFEEFFRGKPKKNLWTLFSRILTGKDCKFGLV